MDRHFGHTSYKNTSYFVSYIRDQIYSRIYTYASIIFFYRFKLLFRFPKLYRTLLLDNPTLSYDTFFMQLTYLSMRNNHSNTIWSLSEVDSSIKSTESFGQIDMVAQMYCLGTWPTPQYSLELQSRVRATLQNSPQNLWFSKSGRNHVVVSLIF